MHRHVSMDSGSLVSKSFNKSIAAGAGGFGTSSKRDTGPELNTDESVPGPGAYVAETSAFPGASASCSAAGSAAFASKSDAGARLAAVDVTDAPSGPSYNPDEVSGMAVSASKTFNKGDGRTGLNPGDPCWVAAAAASAAAAAASAAAAATAAAAAAASLWR